MPVCMRLRLGEPLVGLRGGHALDALLGVLGIRAAEGVQEELAALGLVEGLLVAGRIAEGAEGALGHQLGGLGIVLNLADDLLHINGIPFMSVCSWLPGSRKLLLEPELIYQHPLRQYDNTKIPRRQLPPGRMMNSGEKMDDGYVDKAK